MITSVYFAKSRINLLLLLYTNKVSRLCRKPVSAKQCYFYFFFRNFKICVGAKKILTRTVMWVKKRKRVKNL